MIGSNVFDKVRPHLLKQQEKRKLILLVIVVHRVDLAVYKINVFAINSNVCARL